MRNSTLHGKGTGNMAEARMSRRGRDIARLTLVLSLLILAGCEDRTTHVTGTVTLDGEPLQGVDIHFEPLEPGRAYDDRTGDSGRYELRFSGNALGMRPGRYQVMLTTADHDPPAGEQARPERIPAKYNSMILFRIELEPGFNRIDFELDTQ